MVYLLIDLAARFFPLAFKNSFVHNVILLIPASAAHSPEAGTSGSLERAGLSLVSQRRLAHFN